MSSADFTPSRAVTDQAFHGTTRTAADEILSSGWKLSRGDDQRLGDGVYFFEGSHSMARKWARDKHRRTDRSTPALAVLQSTVEFGVCLSLHDTDHVAEVERLKEGFESAGCTDITDAFIINAFAIALKIDTVRGVRRRKTSKPILGGDPKKDDDYLEWGTELLICVKNLEKILETTLKSVEAETTR